MFLSQNAAAATELLFVRDLLPVGSSTSVSVHVHAYYCLLHSVTLNSKFRTLHNVGIPMIAVLSYCCD